MRRPRLVDGLTLVLAIAALCVLAGAAPAAETPTRQYNAFMGYARQYENEAARFDAKADRHAGWTHHKYKRIADLKRRMARQKRRIAESFLNGDRDLRHDAETVYRRLQLVERRVMSRRAPPPPAGGNRPFPPPHPEGNPPSRTSASATKVVILRRPPEIPRNVAAVRPVSTATGFPETPVAVSFPQAAVRPDDIAVIIGNGNYSGHVGGMPDVVPAYADAAGMKRFVTAALGVREGNVISVRDATQADLVSIFGSDSNPRGRLYNWVRPKKSKVFIFYSGHGAPAGPNWEGHLIPVNANPATIELNGYPLRTLFANLGSIRAKSVTVVIEACFSGVSQGGPLITNSSAVYVRPKELTLPPGVTVISAGAEGQIASWDANRSHSLFTKYFLLGMGGAADADPHGNADGWVDWAELAAYLRDTLTYDARRLYGRDQTARILGSPAAE